MTAPTCAVCFLGGPEGFQGLTASYALVVGTGSRDVAAVARQAEFDAERGQVSGASAFCMTCRRVTWMTRERDPIDALLTFRDRWAASQRMHAAVWPRDDSVFSLQAAKGDVAGKSDKKNGEGPDGSVGGQPALDRLDLCHEDIDDAEECYPQENSDKKHLETGLVGGRGH